MTKRSLVTLILISCAVIALDQLTKNLILASIAPSEVKPVLPGFFNLTLTFNPGVAFGVFSALPEQQRQIALTLTTIIALGVVLFLFVNDYKHDPKAQVALSLVVGGAMGNVIDRFLHGHVIDFLDFYLGSYHWPAFNVADSAICVGVTFLILYSLLTSKSQAPAANRR